MGILSALTGNASAIDKRQAKAEFKPILLDDEEVVLAFQLYRDLIVMTQRRILTLDKQGLSGKKQEIISIPYRSIKKFSKESAGLLDLDAEIKIWIHGDASAIKWEFSKSVDVNQAYKYLSYYVLCS